jgi:hypothetical protein
MTNKFSIKNRLADWGKKSQQLPDNNTTMKDEIVAAARPAASAQKPAKRHNPWFYRAGVLAVSAVAIVLTIMGPDLLAKRTSFGISMGGGGSIASQDAVVSTNYATPAVDMDMENVSYKTAASEGGMEELGISYDETQRVISPIMPEPGTVATLPLDTRELMETRYNASMKTRDVNKLANQAQTIIRGHGGRIDNLSTQEKYAYISFALPKDKFDQMMAQLKDLVPEKMYTETIYAYNRLAEKQSIETNAEKITEEILRLQTEKEELTATHATKADEIQNRIDALTASLNEQYRLKAATTNQTQLSKINDEINRLTAEKKTAETELKTLNSRYEIDLGRLDRSIKRQNDALDNLDVRDETLSAEVETVTGTINIQWVGIWQIIKIYVPIKPIIIGLIVLMTLYLLFRRRKGALKIPA